MSVLRWPAFTPRPPRIRLAGLLFVVACSLASAVLAVAVGAAEEEPVEPVVLGVAYVGLTVGDLEASVRMYQEAARLEEVARGRLEGSAALDALLGRGDTGADWRLLASTNAQVRLFRFDGADSAAAGPAAVPVNGPGIAHVCYQADSTLETYQKFLALGAEPVGNPEMVALNPRNPVLYAYAHDADGALFEVEHVDVSAVKMARPPAGFHRIRHVSLATPDIDRAVAFYSALLGIPRPRRAGGEVGLSGEQLDQVSGLPGTRIKMAWFPVRNLELELIQYLSHPTEAPAEPRPLDAPGYDMVVFDVTDLGTAKARLAAAGGTVATEPEPMDGGEIFFGRDPDGNLLGFQVAPERAVVSSRRFATQ